MKRILNILTLLVLGMTLSVMSFGQESLHEKTRLYSPKRFVYEGDSLVGFNLLQEQVLIQKMIYKEIYREDVLMWMDLWEKERRESEYLFEALKETNDKLLRQETLNEYNERLRISCENNSKELLDYALKLEKKHTTTRKLVVVGLPVAFITGFIIRNNLHRD